MPSVIILLDLNYTLVSNSDQKRSPFRKQIEHEVYRQDLLEALSTHYVILITARPVKYCHTTLESIQRKTGHTFAEWFFNETNLAPHVFKKKVFLERIRPVHPDARFIAIESNPRTIAEYKKLGVLCLSVQ